MSTNNRYNEEFRADVIRLVIEEGRTPYSVGKDLGVNAQTIRNWVKNHKNEQSPDKVKIAELEAELKEKKKQIKDLEMTNDILKKATAFFVKDSQK